MDTKSCLKGLPRKIKVGAYDWAVVLREGAEKWCGEADFETHILSLWPDGLTSPSHCVGILLHECLHVIYDNEKLSAVKGKKDDKEENIVIGFTSGMVSLLRDNPKLLTWIKKCLA